MGSRPPFADAVLLPELSAAYVDIPKVASSSIKILIAQVIGLSLEAAAGDPHQASFPTVDVRLVPAEFFIFAFVRNPWDRLVSCYRDKVGREPSEFTHFEIRPGVADCLTTSEAFVDGMSFEQFVHAVAAIPDDAADAHFRSQFTFLHDAQGRPLADFVGRYENLSADFDRVCRHIGLPPIELPRRQVAPHAVDYRTFYTPGVREIVAERYQRDIERFNYSFSWPTT